VARLLWLCNASRVYRLSRASNQELAYTQRTAAGWQNTPSPAPELSKGYSAEPDWEPDVILNADLVDEVQLRLDEFNVIFPSIG
jgi:hypothetical protein